MGEFLDWMVYFRSTSVPFCSRLHKPDRQGCYLYMVSGFVLLLRWDMLMLFIEDLINVYIN